MALTFDPFQQMDRLTSQLWGSMGQGRGTRWMPMDLGRSGDHYVVNIDLPGVDPGSIDLDVDGNTLTIRAQRTLASEGEEMRWLARERHEGSFVRQLSLGEGIDVEAIHAHYENGVLSLTIPVAEQAKPRKIQIETGARGRQEIGHSEQPVQGEVTSSESQ
jgi:HSP20 family protein